MESTGRANLQLSPSGLGHESVFLREAQRRVSKQKRLNGVVANRPFHLWAFWFLFICCQGPKGDRLANMPGEQPCQRQQADGFVHKLTKPAIKRERVAAPKMRDLSKFAFQDNTSFGAFRTSVRTKYKYSCFVVAPGATKAGSVSRCLPFRMARY